MKRLLFLFCLFAFSLVTIENAPAGFVRKFVLGIPFGNLNQLPFPRDLIGYYDTLAVSQYTVIDKSPSGEHTAIDGQYLTIEPGQTITGLDDSASITSHGGTATVSLLSGTLSCSGGGTLFDIVLDNGTVYTCGESTGDYIYPATADEPIGTLVGFSDDWDSSPLTGHSWNSESYTLADGTQYFDNLFANAVPTGVFLPATYTVYQADEHDTFTQDVVITGTGAEETDYIVQLNLHHGSFVGDITEADVFLNGKSRTDFNDVRFYDGETELQYYRYSYGNYEIISDDSNVGRKAAHYGPDGAIYNEDDVGVYKIVDNTGKKYIYDYGEVVFVDSQGNVFVVKNNILYKTPDSGLTWSAVMDMTAISGIIIPHSGFVEDSSGNLYFGRYQYAFEVKIYKSEDWGDTWSDITPEGYEENRHVHGLHVDSNQTPEAIYASIDTPPVIVKTTDGGETWTEIPNAPCSDDFNQMISGPGYRLVGGEASSYNTPAICRSEDDITWVPVLDVEQTIMGMQRFNDAIYAFGSSSEEDWGYATVWRSIDEGLTWEAIWVGKYLVPSTISSGLRYPTPPGTPHNETEEQIQIGATPREGYYKNSRLYDGGDHYSGIFYIKIPTLPADGMILSIKTGQGSETTSNSGILPDGIFTVREKVGESDPLHRGKANIVTVTNTGKAKKNLTVTGYAHQFNGVTGKGLLATPVVLSGDWAIRVRFRVDNLSENRSIIGGDNSTEGVLWVKTAKTTAMYINATNTAVMGATVFEPDRDYEIYIKREGSIITYLQKDLTNGTEVSNFMEGIDTSDVTLRYIGDYGSYEWAGVIPRITIYNANGNIQHDWILETGPASQGVFYDVVGGNHATMVDLPETVTTDYCLGSYLFENGFELSGTTYIPAVSDSTSAAGNALTNGPGVLSDDTPVTLAVTSCTEISNADADDELWTTAATGVPKQVVPSDLLDMAGDITWSSSSIRRWEAAIYGDIDANQETKIDSYFSRRYP